MEIKCKLVDLCSDYSTPKCGECLSNKSLKRSCFYPISKVLKYEDKTEHDVKVVTK